MKRKTILIFILLALAVVAVIGSNLLKRKSVKVEPFVPKPGKVEEIEYILIKSAFGYDPIDILKPNAAILITNKKEIIEDQQLFLAKKEHDLMSMNGYDYSIQFWRNTDCLSHEFGFNVGLVCFSYKSEEAQKRLDSYLSQLKKAPTHYIYNLKLSVSIKPEQVKDVFKNTDLKIFFIDDTLFRCPSTDIYYEHTLKLNKNDTLGILKSLYIENSDLTEKALKEIILKVKSVAEVTNQSKILLYHEYSNDTISIIEDDVALSFKRGSDMNLVKKIIKSQGAKVERCYIPEFYNVQLLDTSSNIKDIKKKMKKYKIIKGVSEYSDPYK